MKSEILMMANESLTSPPQPMIAKRPRNDSINRTFVLLKVVFETSLFKGLALLRPAR